MSKPQSISGVRKKTRIILEKLKDLTFPRKYQRVLSKKNISKRNGGSADVQICIQFVIESYQCFLLEQFTNIDYPKRKQAILFNNLNTLNNKINEALKNNKPVPRKYVTNILKAHTVYFKCLNSKKINKNCSDAYEKLVLASISVWNNEWK